MVILIVDDEHGLTRLMREALEAWGDVCLVAGDVTEAQEVLVATHVDAMALDLGMPGPDALEWLAQLRQVDPDLARRTLVTTGRALDEDAMAIIAAAGAGHLQKPFRMRQLRDALHARALHVDA